MKQPRAVPWRKDAHFLFLFLLISLAQQFLFQVFMLNKLNAVFPAVVSVVLTALLFGFMHTIYPRPWFNMITATIAGFFFAILYSNFPNLIVAALAHSILNFTAVYFSFFTFVDGDGAAQKTELHL